MSTNDLELPESLICALKRASVADMHAQIQALELKVILGRCLGELTNPTTWAARGTPETLPRQ